MSDANGLADLTEAKLTIFKTLLKPVARIFSNEVSFILVIILCCICYAAWIVYGRLTEFARIEIPKHIEAINSGHRNVAEQFARELRSRDEHYLELRRLDEQNAARVERLLEGRKLTPTNGTSP